MAIPRTFGYTMRMQRVPPTKTYTVQAFRDDQARYAPDPEPTIPPADPAVGPFQWRDFAPGCGTLGLNAARLPQGTSLGLEVLHCRGRTLAMWRLDGAEVGFLLVRVGEA